jgi:fumarate reductase subunit C
MIKNLFKYCIITSILAWFVSSSCFWALNDLRGWRWNWDYGALEEGFTYDNPEISALECDGNTDLWNCTSIKEDEKERGKDTIIRRLLKVFGLKSDKNDDLKFIDYARAILNMALGLIAFIALIMTIYTFYMMFFTEDEAWAKKAKESLIGIFIALGIIWLAWLIVSFIFRWYQSNWKLKEENIRNLDVREVWEFWNIQS